ncbi:cytochrome c1 [Prosthecomicrobium sp. N25]|uniref:cytochrome c1 n=1 Tax=Prosthecomicrobium sp. N25 TaxID=3129254 RepID=UPI00307840C3
MESVMKGNRIARLGRGLLVAAAVGLAGSTAALAAGEVPHIEKQSWTFAGPFGKFDRGQLQRGYKVYKEVCSACHSMKFVSFRNLAQPGGPEFTEEEAKAIAAEYKVKDGPNDEGEMFERPGRLSDRFPSPFANDAAARVANGGALPPDLSLMAKARAAHRGFPWFLFDIFTQYQESGPDYIYALLNGYHEPPNGVTCAPGLNYNSAFLAGTCIAMSQPIQDGQVEYTDGTPATLTNYAKDVSSFMMWAAEPKLEERKHTGFKAMAFLIVFAGLLWFTKRKVWADVAH